MFLKVRWKPPITPFPTLIGLRQDVWDVFLGGRTFWRIWTEALPFPAPVTAQELRAMKAWDHFCLDGRHGDLDWGSTCCGPDGMRSVQRHKWWFDICQNMLIIFRRDLHIIQNMESCLRWSRAARQTAIKEEYDSARSAKKESLEIKHTKMYSNMYLNRSPGLIKDKCPSLISFFSFCFHSIVMARQEGIWQTSLDR